MELETKLLQDILHTLNSSDTQEELIRNILSNVQQYAGMEAAGIRIREGEDFPYFETNGFDTEFLKQENSVCARDSEGEIARNSDGGVTLECMCGRILNENVDTSLPVFTENGSFWSNTLDEVFNLLTKEELMLFRGTCYTEGYKTLALIPLRGKDDMFGLLHLGDKRQGQLSEEKVQFLEEVIHSAGLAIERKYLESFLRESEARYNKLFQASPEGIFIADTETMRFKYANPALCQMTGYTEEELRQMSVVDIHPENSLDHVISEFEAQAREDKTLAPNIPCLRKDGQIIYADINVTKMEIDERDCNVGFFRDITESKQAEQEIRKAKDRYLTLFNSSRDAIMTLAPPNWNFNSGNPSAVEMFGCKDELDFTSKTPYELSPEYQLNGELSSEKAIKMIMTAMDQGSHFFEWTHKKIDGSEFYATVLLTRTELEGVPQLQATVRDITEQKKTEAKLIEAQKMDSIGNLAGGIAHDYNNLLAASLGYLDLLRQKEDDPTKKRYAEIIYQANLRMQDLTQKLLDFARRTPSTKQAVNLNQVVNEVYTMMEHNENNVHINTKLGDIMTIDADYGQMTQVLMNLGVNSIDAMPKGGTLSIETYVTEERVHLRIQDTGQGMDEETLKHVYEPYFTTKKTGEVKGTGLGMAIVYGILKKHNAEISIDSVVEEGTTVDINFPPGEKHYNVSKTDNNNSSINTDNF